MPPRRKSRKKSRRRTVKPMLNALGFAEAYVLTSAATRATFGVNAWDFFTAGILNNNEITTASGNSSKAITLKELVQHFIPGGAGGGFSSGFISNADGSPLWTAVKGNFDDNAWMSIATLVLAPIGFKAAKKVLRKPINSLNRGIKRSGLATMVKV